MDSQHRRSRDSYRLASGCFSLLRQVYSRRSLLPVADDLAPPSHTTTTITQPTHFDPEQRIADLRSQFGYLTRTPPPPVASRRDEVPVVVALPWSEDDAEDDESDREDQLAAEMDRILLKFLATDETARQDVLEEAEMTLDFAVSRQKRRQGHRRDHAEVTLAREYLVAMQQIAQQGLGFVELERSQLSLSLALSFATQDAALQISQTDKVSPLLLKTPPDDSLGDRRTA